MSMIKGSCLCGAVQYQLSSKPKKVTHCHCTMCQKQHGAAFASYVSVPKSDLAYIKGQGQLSRYQSSDNIVREFCSICGSNIAWSGSLSYPDWVSITVATLDSDFQPEKTAHIYTDTAVCWLSKA